MADESVPGGGAAGQGLLLAFDVDCGEVVPGRHLWLRGLRDEGHWPDRLGNRLPDDVAGSWQMVSLDWEVVPAVGRDDPDAAAWHRSDVAEVRYDVDPPLGWDPFTASGVGGATVDAPPGHSGSYGPYPLPDGAREVSFTVIPYLDRRPGGAQDPDGAAHVVERSPDPVGRVVIDLPARVASWEPAAATT